MSTLNPDYISVKPTDIEAVRRQITIASDFFANKLTIPLVVINALSNFINIFIFTRPSFRQVSIGFYLTCISISDIAASVTIIFHFLGFNADTVYLSIHLKSFPFMMYLYTTVTLFSPWISALISIDRFVSIRSVKLMQQMKKRKLQLTILLVLLTVLSSVNLPLWFETYTISSLPGYYTNALPYIEIIVKCGLPFAVMCVFNVISVVHLKRGKAKISTKYDSLKINSKENKLLITSITLNTIFLLTFLPQSILTVITPTYNPITKDIRMDSDTLAEVYRRLLMILSYLRVVYTISQMPIYCVVNRIYRNEMAKILKRITCKKCLNK